MKKREKMVVYGKEITPDDGLKQSGESSKKKVSFILIKKTNKNKKKKKQYPPHAILEKKRVRNIFTFPFPCPLTSPLPLLTYNLFDSCVKVLKVILLPFTAYFVLFLLPPSLPSLPPLFLSLPIPRKKIQQKKCKKKKKKNTNKTQKTNKQTKI